MSTLLAGVLLAVAAVILSNAVSDVREAIDAIPMRALVGIHALRFIGIVFLALTARGELSSRFGHGAGWGDIVVATLAVALALAGLGADNRRRWMFLAWNAIGMVDLLVAVVTAGIVISSKATPGMEPLLRVPLIAVPIIAIPALMAIHVAIFRRLLVGARS